MCEITKKFLIIGFLLVAISAHSETVSTVDQLIAAIIKVESNGNDKAFGDKRIEDHAYGPLQIRKPCVDDVNKRFGTKIKVGDLLGNRPLSIWVCKSYMQMYATKKALGREPTLEDMARIWNGGPTGWKRSTTRVYWAKVQRSLAKLALVAKN